MVKNHLKSLKTPKTWNIHRKETKFTTKPHPGSHNFTLGFSINHVLKHEINLSKTTKESKVILNNSDCLVNGRVIKDDHYNVGFMDVVSFPKIKKHYRVVLNQNGKLALVEIPEKESTIVLSKLVNKTLVKGGKVQLNTLNGANILVDKDDYSTADTLVVEVPKRSVKKKLPFAPGSTIMLIGGSHIGNIGTVEKIDDNKVFFTKDKETYETLRKFAFVLGKDKSEITVNA